MDNELKIKHCMELIERFYSIDNLMFGQAKECALISISQSMLWCNNEDKSKQLSDIYFALHKIDFFDYDQYKNRQYNKSIA